MSTESAPRSTEEEETPPQSPDAEKLDDEPRNLLLALISEIRIGMDLSRITLPTFILEPRSMLEKLTDFMTHGELLAGIQKKQDPVERIVAVVKWYMSGFYIKPQGVKKPYNPLLGEFFRSKWEHADNSCTHFVAEQVSHHPPISCFYFSNRKNGYTLNGSMLPRSKFLGASVASMMEGTATLTIIPFGEEYTITFPNVYGRGILFGTLLMELIGVITIQCNQTNCKAEIDFKAKPFFGGEYNAINGKIKKGKDTLYTLNGKWDGRIDISNAKGKNTEVFWDPSKSQRIPKIVPPIEEQEEFESQRLWTNVTAAIKKKDQKEATAAKTKLEDGQRATVKIRKDAGEEWEPKLFKFENDRWIYKYQNTQPYDPSEGEEEESGGVIYTTSMGKDGVIAQAQSLGNSSELNKSSDSSVPKKRWSRGK